MDTDVAKLKAAGIAVAVESAATQTLVVDPRATIGWFMALQAVSVEPPVNGHGVGYGVFGRVSVDASGVAVVAPVP